MGRSDRENLELIIGMTRHMRFVHPDHDIIALAARNGVRARINAAEAESARLRAVVEKLRAGLKPFGAVADHDVGSEETDADIYRPLTYNHAEKISIGHLRAASRLLAQTAPDVPADQDGRAG